MHPREMFGKSALLMIFVVVGSGCSPLKREEVVAPTTAEERTAELMSANNLATRFSAIARQDGDGTIACYGAQEPREPHMTFPEAARLFDQSLMSQFEGGVESEWVGTATKTARKLAEHEEVTVNTTVRLVHSRR